LIRLLSDPATSPSDVTLSGSREILMTEVEDDWRLDFITYILEKRVPEDKVEHEKIVRRSARHRAVPEVCLQWCVDEVHPPI
jgi:hypothetical protein